MRAEASQFNIDFKNSKMNVSVCVASYGVRSNASSHKQGDSSIASNKTMVPEAKAAMEQFKMQAASEVGVNLQNGYNGDLTARQAGSIGGQMVKKMIESYENSMKTTK